MKLPIWDRKKREVELNEEIESHLRMAIADRMARGESAEEAAISARKELGNIGLIKEVTRDMWGWRIWEQLTQDLRFGLRILIKSPIFTLVAIFSLAFGIGANMAVFQLLNALCFRALPVKDPQQLVEVQAHGRRNGDQVGSSATLTYAQWEQLRSNQQIFTGLFVWYTGQTNLAKGGEVQYAKTMYVNGEGFNVLGIEPVLGRLFSEADDQPNCGANQVVISYKFWQRQFGGQASAIGKTITIDNIPFEIIGITPANFNGVEVGRSFDISLPICAEKTIDGEDNLIRRRDAWWLGAIGRLKPGISLEQATAHLLAISPICFEATIPPNYAQSDIDGYIKSQWSAAYAGSGISTFRKTYETPLWVLMAITGLVLLIACANLANLLLARVSAREREIAIRLALGASRARLIRQFLLESLLLAFLGTFLGAFIGRNLSYLLVNFISTERRQYVFNLELDWRVLAFTIGLSLLTCLIFGLMPALKATKSDPATMIKAGQRGLTASRERFGLRRILVVSQVALSLVLLVGAVLFVRTLINLSGLDIGFQQQGILVTSISMDVLHTPDDNKRTVKRELMERLKAIPGVESVAESAIVPLSGGGWNELVFIDSDPATVSNANQVNDSYFSTMGIPILKGRNFNDRDTASSPRVVLVNEAFKRKLLHDADPIGKSFKLQVGPKDINHSYEIVGLVKDTKYYDLKEEFVPIIYFAESQSDRVDMAPTMLIRSNLTLISLISSIKSTINEFNPQISLSFTVLNRQVADSLMRERLMATLSGFFGILAALLSVIGLYGVMSYMVSQRKNEIGIRMALGATRFTIIKLIVKEASLLLIIGLIVGTMLALAISSTISSMLFGLQPHDLITYLMAIMLLAIVGFLASFLPAQRAAKVDPMIVLRYE